MNRSAEIAAEFERYENGSKAEEQALIDALAAKIDFLQHINRDPKTGQFHRGTHAKGMTCANAEFEVFDVAVANPSATAEEIATLRQGLYRTPGRYPARARFASGRSQKRDDRKPDERALSFSVDLGQGVRQDYSMNSAYIFPIPSLAAFNSVFMLSLINGIRAGKASDEAKKYVISHLKVALCVRALRRIPELGRTLSNAFKITRRKVVSFRQTTYWSGTAFRHGDRDAVKYLAVPCGGEVLGSTPENAGTDYLQDDLRAWVNGQARPVSFDFRVQFLDAEKMHLDGKKFPAWKWVEDPTLNWDAASARDFLVGRLTIPPGSISEDIDDPAIFPAFDVTGNSLAEHKPLGRINRGRAVVELRSRDNRARPVFLGRIEGRHEDVLT
jgi:hypothetical protein